MRLNVPSYNLQDAINYLIKHIIRTQGSELSLAEIADELGVSQKFLERKMQDLNLKIRKPRNTSIKERYFKRFEQIPWNKNVFFAKSSIDTVKYYLELWRKEKKLVRYNYFVSQETPESKVMVYLPKPN